MARSEGIQATPQGIDFISYFTDFNKFFGLIIPTFFINLLALVFPLVLLQVYDRIIPNNAMSTLFFLITGVLIALVLESILSVGRAVISAYADAKFEHAKGIEAFDHILRAPKSEYEKQGAGNYLETFNAISSLKDYYGSQAVTAILDLPFVFTYLFLIGYFGGSLVMVPITMICLSALFAYINGERLQRYFKKRKRLDKQRMNFVLEVLNGIHTVKSMAMEAFMRRRYERLLETSSVCDNKLAILSSNLLAIVSIIAQSSAFFVVAFGSIKVMDNTLSVGALVACTVLTGRSLQPISQAMLFWKRLQSINVSRGFMQQVADLPLEESKGNLELNNGSIELKNIGFVSAGKPLFIDLNLKVKENEMVAIHGSSQSGKSLLLKILNRLSQPTNGQILLGGKDIEQYLITNIRERVAYLPARGTLFEGTILENITLFRDGEYLQRAKEASVIVKANAEILLLPNGYDTRVGDQTSDKLSPSLRQKIIFARTLVNDPKVILFDEANSFMDRKALSELRSVLENLKGKYTFILVSSKNDITSLADRHYKIVDKHLEEL